MMLQEIFQVGGGLMLIAAAKVNLRQEELGMREMRRVEITRLLQVFLGEVRFAKLEVGHA